MGPKVLTNVLHLVSVGVMNVVCVCVHKLFILGYVCVGRGERTLNAVNAFTGVRTVITSQPIRTYICTYLPAYVCTYVHMHVPLLPHLACAVLTTLRDKPTYPPV